jgi:hypothetical protein
MGMSIALHDDDVAHFSHNSCELAVLMSVLTGHDENNQTRTTLQKIIANELQSCVPLFNLSLSESEFKAKTIESIQHSFQVLDSQIGKDHPSQPQLQLTIVVSDGQHCRIANVGTHVVFQITASTAAASSSSGNSSVTSLLPPHSLAEEMRAQGMDPISHPMSHDVATEALAPNLTSKDCIRMFQAPCPPDSWIVIAREPKLAKLAWNTFPTNEHELRQTIETAYQSWSGTRPGWIALQKS